MTYLQAIIYGIVQGLTEFLPVSSSGHLALSQELFSDEPVPIEFDLLLHLATLLAVLIFYRKKLWNLTTAVFDKSRTEDRKLIFLLFIATLPIVAAGFTLKDPLEQVKNYPIAVCGLLCVTGLILFIPGWLQKRAKAATEQGHTLRSAIIMGLGQACALLPGISRSGSTIAAGMIAGVKPSKAADFSFLLAIPAICGALVLKRDDIGKVFETPALGAYLAGMIAAFVTGLFAIYAVLTLIRKGKFVYFGFYCLAVGIAGLIYFTIRGN